MRRAEAVLCSCALPVFAACNAPPITSGLDEPIRVKDAQFVPGPLPGTLAALAPRTGTAAAARPRNPSILGEVLTGRIITAGQQGKDIQGGTASPDTVAVAVALEGAGTGHWLLPTGAPDLTNNGIVGWKMSIDFSPAAPIGLRNLIFAAVNAKGRSGTDLAQPICVVPPIQDWVGPTSLAHNACDPKLEPPTIVLSMVWDTPVDLDLELVTPQNALVDPKHPTTRVAGADGGLPSPSPEDGNLIADANANCEPGGNREQIVWEQKPAPGLYHVYANLFDACDETAVHFSVSLHVREPGKERDTWNQVETSSASGTLVAADANAGSRIGLFVMDFQVQ
jgi:hypothetical protein